MCLKDDSGILGIKGKQETKADLQTVHLVLKQSSFSRASPSEKRKEAVGLGVPPSSCDSARSGARQQPAQAPGGPAGPLTKGQGLPANAQS